jgi:asparagine synthase (glutamine-hydrolysing)
VCGIAGYIGLEPVPQDLLDRCQQLMARRGPDAVGCSESRLADGNVVQFLHSRLSILDLDPRSNQPLATGASTIAINGELYNYIELRKELLDQGVAFSTSGDSEVAARSLEALGLVALTRFESMFALAWLDHETETVLLARDQFGEKPLLAYRTPTGIYFGSDAQYIIALRGARLEVNANLIGRYIVNGYKDVFKRDETFFRGVERIAPGGALVRPPGGDWTTHTLRPKSELSIDETLTFDEAVAGTLQRVVHAADLRLRSDVPVALCLSGGIDSNLLLGVIRNVLDRDVQTFSIVGSDPRYDESAAIARSADWFGITPHVKTMTGFDCLSVLEEVTLERGSPVATANQFALWSLMREISSAGYKVAISGLGADELFTGYYDHHLYYLHDLRSEDPSLARRKRREWEETVLPLVRNPYFRDADRDITTEAALSSLIFGDTEARRAYLLEGVHPWDLSWTEEEFDTNLLRNRMSNELWRETVPLTLQEEDQNAMFWSVENRSPYLDSRLLAWARSVPLRHFIRNGRAKALLRAAGTGIVPDDVLDNARKTGFNLSVTDLLPAERHEAVDFVGDSPLASLIDMRRVSALLAKEDFSDSENKLAFSLLSSAAFMRVFA